MSERPNWNESLAEIREKLDQMTAAARCARAAPEGRLRARLVVKRERWVLE